MATAVASSTETLGVLLAPDDAALVRRRAAEAERSVAAELRFALRPYLADARQEHDA